MAIRAARRSLASFDFNVRPYPYWFTGGFYWPSVKVR
jgi:hypothetical protein